MRRRRRLEAAFLCVFRGNRAVACTRRKRVGLLVHSLVFHDHTSFVCKGLRVKPLDRIRLTPSSVGKLPGLGRDFHFPIFGQITVQRPNKRATHRGVRKPKRRNRRTEWGLNSTEYSWFPSSFKER
jgi:hypothetical protein